MQLHGSLLMACAADGAVRIWRDYTVRGSQRLATAWQSVLVASQVRGLAPWQAVGCLLECAMWSRPPLRLRAHCSSSNPVTLGEPAMQRALCE